MTQGIRVLVEKSLISIEEERIKMSKLLVQLGRQIVQNESVSEPGKRQFLNDASDSGEVLSDDKAVSFEIAIFHCSTLYECEIDYSVTNHPLFMFYWVVFTG